MSEKPERPADDRDDVARLVRLAGKRQAVPPERAERVRRAARLRWQHEVRRRHRIRIVWTAAALAAAACLVVAIGVRLLPTGSGEPSGAASMIRVEALAGRATVVEEITRSRAVAPGDGIAVGSELSTAEASRVALRLASGHSVRLDAATTIRLIDARSLVLERGALYVDSGFETAAAGSLDVRTPFGVLQEIGTQFEVRIRGDAIRVRLREGAVVLRHDEQIYEVRAGGELEMNRDGAVVRRSIAVHGPGWDWIAGIAPMPDLEGRSARAFLEWVARERGWTLSFADESVARAADEIVLGGTVERLSLDQALEAVLPTCRMTHRVDRGVLTVATTAAD